MRRVAVEWRSSIVSFAEATQKRAQVSVVERSRPVSPK